MSADQLVAGYARYTTAAELGVTAQADEPGLSIVASIIAASEASSAACIRFSASAIGTSLLAHC